MKEISLPYIPASGSATGITTLYVSIRRPSDGFRWYTVTPAWEAFNSAHVANGYAIALTEEGASGVYYANFPAGITDAGRFEIVARNQAGGSPAWPADQIVGTETRFEWSGNAVTVPGDLLTIKSQAVTCSAGVTVLASVGTATTSTAQTSDAGAAMTLLSGLFTPGTVSTATSATTFTVAFTGTTPPAAGLAGVWCSLVTPGRAPEKLAILAAASVDSSHVLLTFTSPGFGVAPQAGDAVLIG